MAGHGGKQKTRYTGLRWREVHGPYEALACAIVLQAREDWLNGGDREELRAFLTSDLCRYLAEESGIVYAELLRQTVDA